MSVEFDEKNPDNKLINAFKVSGKRVVVRITDELYQDKLSHFSDSSLRDFVLEALTTEKQRILSEYDEKKSLEKDPKYILTTKGLV